MCFTIIKHSNYSWIPRKNWNWLAMECSLKFTEWFDICLKSRTISAVKTTQSNKR